MKRKKHTFNCQKRVPQLCQAFKHLLLIDCNDVLLAIELEEVVPEEA